MSGLLLRLRPTTPWRLGPSVGRRDRVDLLLRSDTIYAAVTSAFDRLGGLHEWLDATARAASPAVRFTSGFPWRENTLLISPPRHLWPAPFAGRVRAKSARFIPITLASSLVAGHPWVEDPWAVDAAGQSLLSRSGGDSGAALRESLRTVAAVDHLSGSHVEIHATACVEFAGPVGYWLFGAFADQEAREKWRAPLEAAFRWLADSGIGGERSRGWGRFEIVEAREAELSEIVPVAVSELPVDTAHWLLSLYSPAATDVVDWERGSYSVVERGGWVENSEKKRLRMVEEGSVLFAAGAPSGAAPDVAPEGAPHPAFRFGYAVSLAIPYPAAARAPVPAFEPEAETEPGPEAAA